MNKTPKEAEKFFNEFLSKQSGVKSKIIFFVPFLDIEICAKLTCKLKNISIGAQNFYWEDLGAYTGEISIPMLKSIGATSLLVGHSERRTCFKESDLEINKKIKKAVNYNINIVFCVGETAAQRNAKEEKESVMMQIKKGLEGVPKSLIHKILIAYEPVWAIGTGKTATPEDANKMCRFIRMCIEKMYGSEMGIELKILYGGSIDEKNCREILKMSDINGALVGGKSLDPDAFSLIIKTANNMVEGND